MRQYQRERPPYAELLDQLAADLGPIVDAVVGDVGRPDEPPDSVATIVRLAIERLVTILGAGPRPTEVDLDRFRSEGGEAARTGAPVAGLIDRYLSAGWALWDAATRRPHADPAGLAALGSALLRTGDAAAAAIAEGHGEAERDLAGRAASARRAFVDDLLDLAPGDTAGAARLARHATTLGILPTTTWRPTVVALAQELEDGGAEASRVERALSRPDRPVPGRGPAVGPIAAARHGRLVILQPVDGRPPLDPGSALAELSADTDWVAVRRPAAELASVGAAVADALADLAVAVRIGLRGRVIEPGDVALERALLADEAALREAVDRELGPLRAAPRGGASLVATLRAWLDARQNLRATARALGVAPRTVTYRLARIERLIGHRLDGPTVRRLATALLADELLGGSAPGVIPRGRPSP